jgi:hypothetical protein
LQNIKSPQRCGLLFVWQKASETKDGGDASLIAAVLHTLRIGRLTELEQAAGIVVAVLADRAVMAIAILIDQPVIARAILVETSAIARYRAPAPDPGRLAKNRWRSGRLPWRGMPRGRALRQ